MQQREPGSLQVLPRLRRRASPRDRTQAVHDADAAPWRPRRWCKRRPSGTCCCRPSGTCCCASGGTGRVCCPSSPTCTRCASGTRCTSGARCRAATPGHLIGTARGRAARMSPVRSPEPARQSVLCILWIQPVSPQECPCQCGSVERSGSTSGHSVGSHGSSSRWQRSRLLPPS
jgi:hypothetical protein